MMTSTFTWLDHFDRDRRRMLDALYGFSEKDTGDELGLGIIREGVSDRERDELALCDALRRRDEVEGVIGAWARGGLKRLQSKNVWLGIGKWGQSLGEKRDHCLEHRRAELAERADALAAREQGDEVSR